MARRGYTRRQAAKAAGVALRTVDYYRSRGAIQGRMQYVEGHGWLRLYTEDDIVRIKELYGEGLERMNPYLRENTASRNPHHRQEKERWLNR